MRNVDEAISKVVRTPCARGRVRLHARSTLLLGGSPLASIVFSLVERILGSLDPGGAEDVGSLLHRSLGLFEVDSVGIGVAALGVLLLSFCILPTLEEPLLAQVFATLIEVVEVRTSHHEVVVDALAPFVDQGTRGLSKVLA